MFNGVLLAEAFLASGEARSVMVVSGEHNWPLAESATREILSSFDGQMAALTLGDCGAALVLDAADESGRGFQYLEMVTGARHNHFCTSTPSRRGPAGSWSPRHADWQLKGAEHFPTYLKKPSTARLEPGRDRLRIAHQVSMRGIRNGIKVVTAFSAPR